MEKLTLAQLGWVAGIIDGEGSIMIHRMKKQDRPSPYTFILRVTVETTDLRIAPTIHKLLGMGYLWEENKGEERRNCMKWMVQGKKAATFLAEILPFLILKTEQAELGILFQKSKKHWKHLTPEDRDLMALRFDQMKQLKQENKLPVKVELLSAVSS